MKISFVVIVMLLALFAQAEDMEKYLDDTQEMVRDGRYQEALDRFIWFHEHALEHDPAMSGVRLSFALLYWKCLGDVYPPARTALLKIRDHKTSQLANGGGNAALFRDVVAFNQTLDEDTKTVELFQLLDQTRPELAKHCWNIAYDALISAKRYDLAHKYIDNPVSLFARIKTIYNHNKSYYDTPNIEGDRARLKAFNENRLVEASLRLIEFALAIHNEKAAKEIQEKALSLVDDHRLRNAIPTGNSKDLKQ